MKLILVPTDFSECSLVALRFALQIAEVTNAKVILFHSFHIPIPPPDAVVNIIPLQVLIEENRVQLEKIASRELKKRDASAKVVIEYIVISGFATDEIITAAKKHRADLIVMGTHGSSGIKKIVVGSNTANVISKANCPVLVVPEKAKFSNFKRIAFAVDLHEIKDNKVFNPLLELAAVFNSEIKLFCVKKDLQQPLTIDQAIEKLNLENVLKQVPNTFHLAKDENVVHAIDVFVKDSAADLLATLPQKHTFVELMLNKSVTRDLAFHVHIHIPLLCLPE